MAVGVFVFLAACAFWIIGAITGENSYRPNVDDSFHQFNMWWFHISFLCLGLGAIYAIVVRQRAAFSREPRDADQAAEQKTDSKESAPTPYVMLSDSEQP